MHICYGNRHARPSWEGHYDFLFPAIMEAQVDQLVLEFARKGYDDLELFRQYHPTFKLGLGRDRREDGEAVETPQRGRLADRTRPAVLEPDIIVNPDCGLRHLPWKIARDKLRAMSEGAALIRARVRGEKVPA